jgi:heterogeneous nuclear ribonucleoprotein A1/A3
MAFLAQLGGLVRQSIARNALQRHSGAAAIPAMFLVSRGMSGSKLFVGGLAWGTTDDNIKEAFSAFGEVTEVKIICDRDTGRSRGFGFVTFATDQDAEAALQALDGRDLAGRTIRVNYATKQSPQDRQSGGGVYGRRDHSGGNSGNFGGSGTWRGM